MTPAQPLAPQPLVPVQPLVEVRKVWKAFGEKPVLRGVSFALPKGTILAVMGGSGTGQDRAPAHRLGPRAARLGRGPRVRHAASTG